MDTRAADQYRRTLASQMRQSAAELEEAILDRILALEEPSDFPGLPGLQRLVKVLVSYGCLATELGEGRCPPPPPEALSHARKVAWQALPARILHERYLTAYTVFNKFLRSRGRSAARMDATDLCAVQHSNDIVFERLVKAVGDDHERELQTKARSRSAYTLDRVKQLLEGELVDLPEVDYDLAGTHLGLVGAGPDIRSTVSQLSTSLGGTALLVEPSPGLVWAWFGWQDGQHLDLASLPQEGWPAQTRISAGAPASGPTGWRLTHRQAIVGWPVAQRLETPITRYSEVALLASALGDPLLTTSLIREYLQPLKRGRKGGEDLRRTLRAYFASQRHVSSAAALLEVRRHTVTDRLKLVEQRLGRPLHTCATELELVLRIEELGFTNSH